MPRLRYFIYLLLLSLDVKRKRINKIIAHTSTIGAEIEKTVGTTINKPLTSVAKTLTINIGATGTGLPAA